MSYTTRLFVNNVKGMKTCCKMDSNGNPYVISGSHLNTEVVTTSPSR
jgi:hypothetical protein